MEIDDGGRGNIVGNTCNRDVWTSQYSPDDALIVRSYCLFCET